jgi:hypothetical protein
MARIVSNNSAPSFRPMDSRIKCGNDRLKVHSRASSSYTRRMTKPLIALLASLLAAAAASAALADDHVSYTTPKDHPSAAQIAKAGGCAPKDNTARVLKSAHPLDLAPNWTGTTYIGTGWTFMPSRYVATDIEGGIFLEGHLITTRGAEMPDDLFILYAEWDCAR